MDETILEVKPDHLLGQENGELIQATPLLLTK